MVTNCLYECSMMHKRLVPPRPPFHYRVFLFAVDIDELPALGRETAGFSHNRFNLFAIDDRDHVGGDGIRRGLTEWLRSRGFECPPDARIRLVSFPRVLGYGFNPVSFYYIETRAGQPVATVAEVTNTYREMKLYLLRDCDATGRWHLRVAKDFYVSPFSDPGAEFDFTLGPVAEKWLVKIDTRDAGRKVLASAIRGEMRELTSRRLLWFALKYPLLSLKIIGLIYWQAFLLWFGRVPFFRKTDRLEAQSDVLRPHSSLTKHKQ
jgi:DUF1365 family protein